MYTPVLKIRDRDDKGNSYDTAYFSFTNEERRLATPVFDIGEADGHIVVIDGIFGSSGNGVRFQDCAVRWHGPSDDWEAAIKAASNGINVNQLKLNWNDEKNVKGNMK